MKKWFLLLTVVVFAMAGCGDDNNNGTNNGQPTINGMNPNQVSIGQLAAVATITGTNLSGVTSVQLGDGITVTGFESRSANELGVTFDVSKNASAGPRTISVTATGGTATSATMFNVTSNKAPTASFTMDPSAGSITTVFTFDASNSVDAAAVHSVTSYNWDFGDGKSAQGKKVTHKFTTIGSYKVLLSVGDNEGGTATASRSLEITKNSPPIPKMTISPNGKGDTNTLFHFDASKTKDPDSKIDLSGYVWDFGDGSRKKGVIETDHQYEKQGKYDVTLSVTDRQGLTATTEARLEVEKSTEKLCAGNGGNHQTIIKGRVVAVEANNWAITDFGQGATCQNTYHKCDDFRRLSPEGFYGIVDKMTDRGNGILGVHNACPYRWPPQVGERVFIYYKSCAINYCP
jgi:PKD repeat protein